MIETMDIFLLADSYSCLAESILAMYAAVGDRGQLLRAKTFLEIAQNCESSVWPMLSSDYLAMENFEGALYCLGRLAILSNDIGDIQGREAASHRFCELKEKVTK
jgi:hypothetical protein